MTIRDFDQCKSNYDAYYGADTRYDARVTDHMICAIGPRVDSCTGDSGGPLIGSVNGEALLIGVVSFGGVPSQRCANPKYPGVYTEVADYVDFIKPHLYN